VKTNSNVDELVFKISKTKAATPLGAPQNPVEDKKDCEARAVAGPMKGDSFCCSWGGVGSGKCNRKKPIAYGAPGRVVTQSDHVAPEITGVPQGKGGGCDIDPLTIRRKTMQEGRGPAAIDELQKEER